MSLTTDMLIPARAAEFRAAMYAAGTADVGLFPSPQELGLRPGTLIAVEDFQDGPQGWVQLYTQNLLTEGPMAWLKDRHSARIEVRTPDVAGYEAMAIRRYAMTRGTDFYLDQVLLSIHETDAVNPRPLKSPKWFEYTLDTAKDDGARNYFSVKYIRNATGLNVNGTTTDVTDKIMISTYSAGVTTFYDMGSFTWPVNESKCLPVPISLLVNVNTGKYHGLAVGRWIKKGVFADTNRGELAALPAAGGPNLPRFASGFNALVVVNNLDASALTEGVAEVLGHRTFYMGSSL